MEVNKKISHIGLAFYGNVTGVRGLGKKVNPLNKQKRNCRPTFFTTSSFSQCVKVKRVKRRNGQYFSPRIQSIS